MEPPHGGQLEPPHTEQDPKSKGEDSRALCEQVLLISVSPEFAAWSRTAAGG